ncbi:MAG: DUF3592 domain-containing protein, partial [Ruminococcus sp.]|nr:DUF3592 domain-containing protein [Ruminococcus sp.]
VMGILVFSMQKNKIQSASLLILPIIGIFMVICGLAEIFGNNQSMGSLMGILPYIIMGAFVLAGIAIAVVTTIDNKKRKKRCTVPMQAVVIDLIPARRRRYGNGMHGKRAYTPVYEYYYYGVMYRKRDKYATNINIPQIGEQVTAFINPDNPEDAYFEYKNKSITTLLIAAAFIAIPAIILFTMLFNR